MTLTVQPENPRMGETVRVSGRVAAAGVARSVGISLARRFHGGWSVGTASVAADGTLTGEFAAPASDQCVVVRIDDAQGPAMSLLPSLLQPDRCASLPETAWAQGDFEAARLQVVPAEPAPGQPVTLRGQFHTPYFTPGRPTAHAWLFFAPAVGPDARQEIPGNGSVDSTGHIEFTFVPGAVAAWSGKCVEVVLQVPSSGAPSHGWARFDWP